MDEMEPSPSWAAHGFSLVSLLLVIVVLGILTASAIVGVSTLTDTGTGSVHSSRGGGTSVRGRESGSGSSNDQSAGSACAATADAAKSASSLYFVNSGFRSYPVKWSEMTASNPPIYNLATNVVVNARNPRELDGRGWKLIMSGGGINKSKFTCS